MLVISHRNERLINELFVGRSIVAVDEENDTLTLDNGKILKIVANEGCSGCLGGLFHLKTLNMFENRIMRAVVKYTSYYNSDSEEIERYELFVFGSLKGKRPKTSIAAVEGSSAGSGYYGEGFTITVIHE